MFDEKPSGQSGVCAKDASQGVVHNSEHSILPTGRGVCTLVAQSGVGVCVAFYLQASCVFDAAPGAAWHYSGTVVDSSTGIAVPYVDVFMFPYVQGEPHPDHYDRAIAVSTRTSSDGGFAVTQFVGFPGPSPSSIEFIRIELDYAGHTFVHEMYLTLEQQQNVARNTRYVELGMIEIESQ